MNYKFSHSILGGTFDHFHKGHEHFLISALASSLKVTIGITSEQMLTGKRMASTIEDYKKREESVTHFLLEKGYKGRFEIYKLTDIYGPGLEDGIDGIFVIPETLENGKLINSARKEKGLDELEITVVPTVNGDDGKTISSTRIRNGEIDRAGNAYVSLFDNKTTLKLPLNLRDSLKESFGRVEKDLESNDFGKDFMVSVGDIVTAKLLMNGITPDICLFDHLSNRTEIKDAQILNYLPTDSLKLDNKPGEINCKTAIRLFEIINNCLSNNKKASIEINGEEDLLALPAMLFAPLNAKVIYGLSGKGAVIVTVTENLKQKIKDNFILKFT